MTRNSASYLRPQSERLLHGQIALQHLVLLIFGQLRYHVEEIPVQLISGKTQEILNEDCLLPSCSENHAKEHKHDDT